MGVIHQKVDVGHAGGDQLLAHVPRGRPEHFLMAPGPQVVDIFDDGQEKGLLVLEVPVRGGAGHPAGGRHPPEGEVLYAVFTQLFNAGLNQ